MDIDEAYMMMQKESGIVVGDTVKVMRSCVTYEMGWQNTWEWEMDNAVGMIGIVKSVAHDGIEVKFDDIDEAWNYPFFVLQVIGKSEPKKTYHDLCCNLKPFDKVLVRDDVHRCWWPKNFCNVDDDGDFCTIDDGVWEHCIPYEGYEHYIGTRNNHLEQE